jgi:hypothetical protein
MKGRRIRSRISFDVNPSFVLQVQNHLERDIFFETADLAVRQPISGEPNLPRLALIGRSFCRPLVTFWQQGALQSLAVHRLLTSHNFTRLFVARSSFCSSRNVVDNSLVVI